MASCMMIARSCGIKPYLRKSDNRPAYTLSISMDDGSTLALQCVGENPGFKFGTMVTINFDLRVFDSKVNGIQVESVKEYKG